MLARPQADEFAPYYGRYIALVPDGDVRDHLRRQLHETIALFSGVSDDRANRGYGPGKWTLKEMILHMSDTERVFSYRLLRVARNDATPLPGFEQDDWVPHSNANRRSVSSLMLEFAAIRSATLQLADSLDPAAWLHRGTASGFGVSARALIYITAGHELHHLGVARERYLAA
ncbi:MAG: DinB family protein [Gemmatimonadetes bacterium]|nr:DinB family protein [Gemmatimonadota bacterium]